MKSQSIRRAFFSGFVLVCPLLTFAGSQSVQMYVPTKAEMRDRTVATQAALQGKGGGGVTRNQTVLRGNAIVPKLRRTPGVPQYAPLPRDPTGTTGPYRKKRDDRLCLALTAI